MFLGGAVISWAIDTMDDGNLRARNVLLTNKNFEYADSISVAHRVVLGLAAVVFAAFLFDTHPVTASVYVITATYALVVVHHMVKVISKVKRTV
jgi:hypothetical protein